MGDLRGLGVLGPERLFLGLGVRGPLGLLPSLSLGSVGGESGSGGVRGGLPLDFDTFLAGIMVGGGGDGDLGSSRFLFLGGLPLSENRGAFSKTR